jgi:fucose permease
MSWLPTFNSRILNLSTSLSIQMASILAAATALGRFTAGIVLKKFDWFRVLTIGLLSAALLVIVALPMAASVSGEQVTSWGAAPIAAFFFPLIGFCIAPIYPAINSVILSALPTHQHGSMAGLIVVFSALGGTSGSIITGFLFEAVGGQNAFYFSLLPIAAILFTLYLFKRKAEELGHA